MQVLLPPECVDLQLIKVGKPQNEPPNEPPNEPQPAEKSVEAEKLGSLHAAELHAESEHQKSVETKDLKEEKTDKELGEETNESLLTLPDQVKESNRNNLLFTEIREFLANLVGYKQPIDVYFRGSRAANELLYKDNKLWVAKNLRLDVIQEVHDQPAVGHSSVRKTVLLIQQHYFWPRMKQDID